MRSGSAVSSHTEKRKKKGIALADCEKEEFD